MSHEHAAEAVPRELAPEAEEDLASQPLNAGGGVSPHLAPAVLVPNIGLEVGAAAEEGENAVEETRV
jgi:hypothetical protein